MCWWVLFLFLLPEDVDMRSSFGLSCVDESAKGACG